MEQLDDVQTELGGQQQVWRDFELVVVSGRSQGARVRVDSATPPRIIGSSRSSDLVIEDPAASRRHLKAESTEQGLVITDLESTNGTFLNGVRIVGAFAASSDRIRVGKTELRVEMAKATDETAPHRERFGRIVGGSEAMQRLYPILDRLVATTAPVLVEGPAGSGKELVAETLHELGQRPKGPFVVFDCPTMSGGTMAERLFGEPNGGGGAFQQADGGTLYIDEVGDLDQDAQGMLYRAIAPGPGSTKADVRVIASSRRDLEGAVQFRRFREDLHFELAALRIELPPLRARRGDVERLAVHFWTELGGRGRLADETLQRLSSADWLGNVTELKSAMARIVALGDAEVAPTVEPSPKLDAGLADPFEPFLAEDLAFPVARQRVMDAFDRRYIHRALERAGGNATAAAAASGIARRYFYTIKKRAT